MYVHEHLTFQHSLCLGFVRPCMLLSFGYVLYGLNKKKGGAKKKVRYLPFFWSLNNLFSFQANLRDTTRAFSVHGGSSPSAKSTKEGIKCKQHTTFDVAASLSNTRKAKHVRFSPGETVEVQFCA